MSLTPDQTVELRVQQITDALLHRQNVFLSGPGGTGKSYMLKKIAKKLAEHRKNVAITGSTGVAAESIGGVTLHSWAAVQLGNKSADVYATQIAERNKAARKRWCETSVLIIDEISMTGGKFFQMISDLGSIVRGLPGPFGGLTLLICGDVCQLPPVNDYYFFHSEAYKAMDFRPMRLTHPWRFQKDLDFFYLLSRARVGELTQDDIELLKTRRQAFYDEVQNHVYEEGEIKPTRMFSKKLDVAHMNNMELQALPGEEFRYICFDTFEKKNKTSTSTADKYRELMDKNVAPELVLRIGAQVMLTANLDVANGLCNGSRGVVLECYSDKVFVKFRNGMEQYIQANAWSFDSKDEIFTRYQIPLILAWSNTIHKCQSATLDSIIIDLGPSIFSDNMAYVALSRCRSIDSIYITNLDETKIRCDPEALEFEKSIANVEW